MCPPCPYNSILVSTGDNSHQTLQGDIRIPSCLSRLGISDFFSHFFSCYLYFFQIKTYLNYYWLAVSNTPIVGFLSSLVDLLALAATAKHPREDNLNHINLFSLSYGFQKSELKKSAGLVSSMLFILAYNCTFLPCAHLVAHWPNCL